MAENGGPSIKTTSSSIKPLTSSQKRTNNMYKGNSSKAAKEGEKRKDDPAPEMTSPVTLSVKWNPFASASNAKR